MSDADTRGSSSRDIEWLRIQLAAARWHLDAAVGAPAAEHGEHLRRAQRACAGAEDAFALANLKGSQQQEVERELAALKRRLQLTAAGS
jgi:hypothetical protein